MKKLFVLGILVIAFHAVAGAQCRETWKFCRRGDKSFQFNSQSTSGVVEMGNDQTLSIMVYKDVVYRFSFCSDRDEVNGKIQFDIFEMKTVQRYDPQKQRNVYEQERVYVFRNTEVEMVQEIEFTSRETRRLFVRIVVPEAGSGDRKMKMSDYVCVGALVEHKKGEKVGFSTVQTKERAPAP
jgi:hypothetical protein